MVTVGNKQSKKRPGVAIDTEKDFAVGSDVSSREKEIIKKVSEELGFVPVRVIWRSGYWGTQKIGAIHYLGKHAGINAVLKIQGAKPNISEAEIIKRLSDQNRSRVIRPPKIYKVIPWNDDDGFEALLMEYADGKKIIESKKIQSGENIAEFFNYYLEYRENCLPKVPWIEKPDKENWHDVFARLINVSQKAHPNHPFREKSDSKLIDDAGDALNKIYKNTKSEFVHGHFSFNELVRKGGEVILFSNLFWKWKMPFYDAVFAQHWFMYELEHVRGITPRQVEKQRDLWHSEIFKVTGADESGPARRYVVAALLERAVSGTIVDGLMTNKEKKISKYLYDSTRDQVVKLMGELKSEI